MRKIQKLEVKAAQNDTMLIHKRGRSVQKISQKEDGCNFSSVAGDSIL